MKASVIIPMYNRKVIVDRAIKSILSCTGSENVQIVVVDDCSKEPFESSLLRKWDIVYRNPKNVGANVSRQIGIQKAIGEVIYLLDSDDYYINRNFNTEYEKVLLSKESIHYCSYMYGRRVITKIPDTIIINNYFDYILNLYPGIAITSSLCFHKSVPLELDLTLGRCQDWDFIHTFLKKGNTLKKIDGVVFIDRSDKASISRKKDYTKTLPWLDKLQKTESEETYKYVKYWILSKYRECMDTKEFIALSFRYLMAKKINRTFILKRIVQRFL